MYHLPCSQQLMQLSWCFIRWVPMYANTCQFVKTLCQPGGVLYAHRWLKIDLDTYEFHITSWHVSCGHSGFWLQLSRGCLILPRASTGLHTSQLQWSSAWPPATSPQDSLTEDHHHAESFGSRSVWAKWNRDFIYTTLTEGRFGDFFKEMNKVFTSGVIISWNFLTSRRQKGDKDVPLLPDWDEVMCWFYITLVTLFCAGCSINNCLGNKSTFV